MPGQQDRRKGQEARTRGSQRQSPLIRVLLGPSPVTAPCEQQTFLHSSGLSEVQPVNVLMCQLLTHGLSLLNLAPDQNVDTGLIYSFLQ